jgi:6-phosphogluconolactonase (cycloisomerase 2 family)
MVPKPFETVSSSSNQVVRYTKQFDVSNLENCCDLFVVSTYTDFDRLAHGPRGTESKNPIYVYRFNPSDGSMVLVNVTGDKRELVNPAFSRFHPRLNVVYSCTEDVENNGVIFAYAIDSEGGLTKLGRNVDAGGTSTCYLTFDKAQRHMLTVNYWDSTLAVIPTCSDTGELIGPINSMYDPKHGNKIVSAHKKCNHSKNDEFTINERQKDPHSHALVLDPFYGCVAYVPDLGKDVIREFLYDKNSGRIVQELNSSPSSMITGTPNGPRYIEFHPHLNITYVVNELSSTVAVFSVDKHLLKEIATTSPDKHCLDRFLNRPSLKLIQVISTIPNAFPRTMNTCGRICVHKSGHFVIVSNRGHESITIFRVNQSDSKRGHLKQLGLFHTRGETPRHFQFDSSGQFLIVANQDSNTIAVFSFNLSTGEIKYTGNEYRVPSPNFVCCCPIHHNDAVEKVLDIDDASMTSSLSLEHSTRTNDGYHDDKRKNVELQLELAQLEISELKRKLSSVQNGNLITNV